MKIPTLFLHLGWRQNLAQEISISCPSLSTILATLSLAIIRLLNWERSSSFPLRTTTVDQLHQILSVGKVGGYSHLIIHLWLLILAAFLFPKLSEKFFSHQLSMPHCNTSALLIFRQCSTNLQVPNFNTTFFSMPFSQSFSEKIHCLGRVVNTNWATFPIIY